MKPTREGWKALRDVLSTLDVVGENLGFTIEWYIQPKGQSDMEIDLQEGETIADAVKRMAKAQAATGSDTKVVVVHAPKKEGSKSPKSKKGIVPATTLGGDPSEGSTAVPAAQTPHIYSALHVYRREGDTDQKVKWNANHEREMHGPNTLVFAHLHHFSEMCGSACTVKVEAE